MMPQVLKAFRSGNLDLSDVNSMESPLNEIYYNTYQYIDFPDLSDPAKIILTQAVSMNKNSPLSGLPELSQMIAERSMRM